MCPTCSLQERLPVTKLKALVVPVHTHTHTRLMALCPGLPGWAGTRKVKPIWILLEQKTVSGSGISCAICKPSPLSRQITTPALHYTHTRLTALFPGQPGWAGTRKVKPIWISLKQDTVSGSGIKWAYASLHLAPDRQPHQHLTTQFFTGRMSFLPPNQQRQSTEGRTVQKTVKTVKNRQKLQTSFNRFNIIFILVAALFLASFRPLLALQLNWQCNAISAAITF